MPVSGPGPYQLRKLSARLREAGKEGQGLRRELYKAINQAAKPLAAEIRNSGHLGSYMPDRYAAVLAGDLAVTATKSTSKNPGVAIRAKGRRHKRKVIQLDNGILKHPLYGNREHWFEQVRGKMRRGFFTDPAERAAPGIRDQVVAALHETGKKITS
jgi:hypothetical protein